MKESLKWAAASLVIYLAIAFLIPVNIFHSLLYLIATGGAVAITFTIIKLLSTIFLKDLISATNNTNLTEDEKTEAIAKAYNPSGCVIVPIMMILFFSAGALIILRCTQMEKNEINQYGQLSFATVSNGRSLTGRTFDLSDIYLTFKPTNGDSLTVDKSVSASQFHKFYKNQTIPIIYSSRYPSIFKVISTQEELDKYLKRSTKHSL